MKRQSKISWLLSDNPNNLEWDMEIEDYGKGNFEPKDNEIEEDYNDSICEDYEDELSVNNEDEDDDEVVY